MAICGGCGAETTRTRMVFNEKHVLVKEECDKCNPQSFDPKPLSISTRPLSVSTSSTWQTISPHPNGYMVPQLRW